MNAIAIGLSILGLDRLCIPQKQPPRTGPRNPSETPQAAARGSTKLRARGHLLDRLTQSLHFALRGLPTARTRLKILGSGPMGADGEPSRTLPSSGSFQFALIHLPIRKTWKKKVAEQWYLPAEQKKEGEKKNIDWDEYNARAAMSIKPW